MTEESLNSMAEDMDTIPVKKTKKFIHKNQFYAVGRILGTL